MGNTGSAAADAVTGTTVAEGALVTGADVEGAVEFGGRRGDDRSAAVSARASQEGQYRQTANEPGHHGQPPRKTTCSVMLALSRPCQQGIPNSTVGRARTATHDNSTRSIEPSAHELRTGPDRISRKVCRCNFDAQRAFGGNGSSNTYKSCGTIAPRPATLEDGLDRAQSGGFSVGTGRFELPTPSSQSTVEPGR